jgi:hypothetical protein
MHAFIVMYNIGTGVPNKYIKPIMVIIQEMKRNMILRRFKRETNNGVIINYNQDRLPAHLPLTVQKIQDLREYQGKKHEFFEAMQKVMKEMKA